MNEKKRNEEAKKKGGGRMIKGFVQGQTLKLAQTRVVADTIDYLIAQFRFQGEDWRALEKWMHLQQGEQLYVIKLTNDRTRKSDHLNLSAGEWAIWLHGNENVNGEVTQRITTNICAFTVERSGALEGDVLPELPASIGEQLEARIALLEDNESRLPIIDASDEGKVLTAVGGAWELQEIDITTGVTVDSTLSETSENPVQNKVITAAFLEASGVLTQFGETIDAMAPQLTPAVTAQDDGKLMQVVDGVWTTVAVADSSIKTYIDVYINEALGGDY